MVRTDGRWPVVIVGLVVVISTAARSLAGWRLDAPWITPDETLYALMGRTLWRDGQLGVFGVDTSGFGTITPLLTGAPQALFDPATALFVAVAIQALLVSLSAVIAFLWARRLASTGWALIAAVLVVTPPVLAYAGLLMSEPIAYTGCLLALLLIARALENATFARQTLALAGVLLAVGIRLQLVVLLPAFLLAIVLTAVLARETATLRRFTPTFLALAVGIMGAFAWALAGGSPSTLLGGYESVSAGAYNARSVLSETMSHLADVGLLVAVVPLLATAMVVVIGLRHGERDPALRAFIAIAASYVPLLTIQVAVFASQFVDHVAERYLVTAVPVLLLGLVVWASRGAPRPRTETAVLAVAGGALVIVLPIDELTADTAVHDALSALPLLQLGDDAGVVWVAGGLCAVVAFALLPRRLAPALVAAVGASLALSSIAGAGPMATLTSDARQRDFAVTPPDWIDKATARDVTMFHTSERFWPSVWLHTYWNDRVRTIVRTPDAPIPGPLRQYAVSPRFDGALFTTDGARVDPPAFVAPATIEVAGAQIATLRQVDTQHGLVLWYPERPLRLLQWVRGTLPNGDITGVAQISVYACGPGVLELTLLGKSGSPVIVRRDGAEVARIAVAPGDVWNGTVPGPTDADPTSRCVFELETPELVGSTVIHYVRT